MKISMIAAMDENGLIGAGNDLPWGKISRDMAHFRKLTEGKPVVMGRKTFESIFSIIGKPLPNRINIVLTKNRDFHAPGCIVATSLDEALAAADDAEEVVVIGGATVYTLFAPIAKCLYLTIIHGSFTGDTYFPSAINLEEWEEIARENHTPGDLNQLPITFKTLRKKA